MLVQAVLLYGPKAWVITYPVTVDLELVYIGFSRGLTIMIPRSMGGGGGLPTYSNVLEVEELQTVGKNQVGKNTMVY